MTLIDIALEFIGLLTITVLGIIGLLTATDKFARYMMLRDEKRKWKEEKMRLIDADALLKKLNEERIPYNADVNFFIANAPTIEAETIEHVSMTDYIKREDALEQFDYYDLGEYLTTQIRGMLMDIPSADVSTVRHGEWIRTGEPPLYVIECSECGQRFFHHEGQAMPKYCSNCGAKMEGEEDETD